MGRSRHGRFVAPAVVRARHFVRFGLGVPRFGWHSVCRPRSAFCRVKSGGWTSAGGSPSWTCPRASCCWKPTGERAARCAASSWAALGCSCACSAFAAAQRSGKRRPPAVGGARRPGHRRADQLPRIGGRADDASRRRGRHRAAAGEGRGPHGRRHRWWRSAGVSVHAVDQVQEIVEQLRSAGGAVARHLRAQRAPVCGGRCMPSPSTCVKAAPSASWNTGWACAWKIPRQASAR